MDDVAIIGIPLALALLAIALLLFVLYRRIDGLDVTLREERQELQAELGRREEYVAALARELMNPIAAISYAARAIATGGGRVDAQSLAGGIAAEAASATDMVQKLGDAARAEAHRLHLALAPLDLNRLARDTVAAFDPGPSHEVRLEASHDRLLVTGDEVALTRVLRSLLSNAVAYSPPSVVWVDVRRGSDDDSAVIGVVDEGPGIPEVERPLLFQKFARLSSAGGTVGAGLGLYLSRAIVEEHGGVLSVGWPAAGGSRFWFTVPLAGEEMLAATG